MENKTIFETLSAINVNDKTEKKNGLTYLSWAWAWAEVKKLYPNIQRTVYENANGLNYFHDERTAWVKVGITIEALEHIDYLPIMDNRNKSIQLDNITSFDVNKAIQRSTAKALALHGLGLYIYAGEDLPEGYEAPAPLEITTPKKSTLDKARFIGAMDSIKKGFYTVDKLKENFELSEEQKAELDKFINEKTK